MRKFVLPALATGLLVFAVWHVVAAQQAPPKQAPPVQPANNPFAKTVAGAGTFWPTFTSTSATIPGRGEPIEMFSVWASTMPAPATVSLNGACAGVTGGAAFGRSCWARTTW